MLPRRWCPVIVAIAACAHAQEGARGVDFYSQQKEAALGAHLADEVRRNSKPLDVPGAREYVERIGRALAPEFTGGLSYSFSVTAQRDGGLREPYVLPGGYVFVPAGLFLAAANEGEFAGMLAHSMAHAALRHGTRQATRAQIVNYASIPLVFMGGWTGINGRDASLAAPLGFRKFMRGYELEADSFAVPALARAGYDPAALVRYIDLTQVDREPVVRSTLPPRGERLAELERAILELPAREYTAGTGEYDKIRDAVRKAAIGNAPSLRRR
jgi:predicted Zn-dependent protease